VEWGWRVRVRFAVTVVPLEREDDIRAIEEHFAGRFGSGRVEFFGREWIVRTGSEQEGLRYLSEIDDLIAHRDLLLVAQLQRRVGGDWVDAEVHDDSVSEDEILGLLESDPKTLWTLDDEFTSAFYASTPLRLVNAAPDWSRAEAEVVIDAGTEAFALATRLNHGGTANLFDRPGVRIPAADEESARLLEAEIRIALGEGATTEIRSCNPPEL
jgi:hypothetical protein